MCFARTNMHENYVNGPWTGFNVLHIIKKLNKQKRALKGAHSTLALVRHVF